MSEEGVEPTPHAKIFRARISRSLTSEHLNGMIEKLEGFVTGQNRRSLLQTLSELIPDYQPNRYEKEVAE